MRIVRDWRGLSDADRGAAVAVLRGLGADVTVDDDAVHGRLD